MRAIHEIATAAFLSKVESPPSPLNKPKPSMIYQEECKGIWKAGVNYIKSNLGLELLAEVAYTSILTPFIFRLEKQSEVRMDSRGAELVNRNLIFCKVPKRATFFIEIS